MTNKEYANALRDIAALYDKSEGIPQPNLCMAAFGQSKESLSKIASIIGSCTKRYTDSFFSLKKSFGGVTLEFTGWRSEVCSPKVVGKRTVLKDVPTTVYEKKEVEEDIIEWECPDSLLKNEGETSGDLW